LLGWLCGGTPTTPTNLFVCFFDSLLVFIAASGRTEKLGVFEYALALQELISALEQWVGYLATIHTQHLELVTALLAAEYFC